MEQSKYTPQGMLLVNGCWAIKGGHTELRLSNQETTLKEATSKIQEIKVLGNSAWMRNYLDLVISSANGGSKRYSGYTLTILEKNPDGQWVISRDANLVMPKGTD